MTTFSELNPGETTSFPSGKAPEIQANLFSKYSRVDRNRFIRVCKFIEEHCSEFLASVNAAHRFLYRGIKTYESPSEIFLGRSRNDRHPRDTDADIQLIADEYLTLRGFKALRSNSIFCAGEEQNALTYGDPYIIFPINGFDYTWSLEHVDWVISPRFLSPNYSVLRNIFNDIYYSTRDDTHKATLTNIAIKNAVEIYVKPFIWSGSGDGYFYDLAQLRKFMQIAAKLSATVEEVRHYFTPEVRAKINRLISNSLNPKIASQQFVKLNKLLKTRLDTAIKLDHEVMIHGSYVAVESNKFNEALGQYFLNIN